MRSKILGALLVACAVSAAAATSAGALVISTPTGRIGYLPLNEAAEAHAAVHPGAAASRGATTVTGEPPLLYHGGPIMHSQTSYAIFWAPSGYAFPVGYETAITGFLQNVATDSGKPSNVYSVGAQYTDGTGHATYSDTYGGAVTDTTAYPTSGTCPTYSGAESFTACITDAKLEEEVESVRTAQVWPSGLGAEYYVVLPPHAGSCFEAAGNVCFDKQFCAYHSYTLSTEAIYANIGYSPGDVSGCGVGEYPNGHANGNVDDTLSSLSHEANESITDPKLNAWFDKKGFENGDECRNTPSHEDYGAPLGGLAGALFNQSIGGGHYYLQQEWSNDIEDCAQRVTPATPAIADPGQVVSGQSASFDGSGSAPGAGGIVSYGWDFGDGGTASGPTPSHTYATTGSFTVTLTVKDDGGFAYSTTREVTVTSPPHSLTVSLAGTGSGTVAGTGVSCPGTCSHNYPSGESVTLTATPTAGSTFTGWSGGGCSGTGTCEVTMSSDRIVTATFTASGSGGGGSEVSPQSGGGATPTPAPAPVSAPIPIARHKNVPCRKGFKRIRKHGKSVCARVKKHGKHH